MKKWISETWDNLLDELAFFLVGVWVNRKYILSCLVLVPFVGFAYYWLYWLAGCLYTGQGFPQWMRTGYYVIVGAVLLAALFGLVWGIIAALEAMLHKRDTRRLGYVRIGRNGEFYLDNEDREDRSC